MVVTSDAPLGAPTTQSRDQSRYEQPDRLGRFGRFGGKYVPETLMPALSELEEAFGRAQFDLSFKQELKQLLKGLCR